MLGYTFKMWSVGFPAALRYLYFEQLPCLRRVKDDVLSKFLAKLSDGFRIFLPSLLWQLNRGVEVAIRSTDTVDREHSLLFVDLDEMAMSFSRHPLLNPRSKVHRITSTSRIFFVTFLKKTLHLTQC